MKSWFQVRGYPEHLVQKKIANYKKNKKQNSNVKQSKSKRLTFVVTYHPVLKYFQSLIKNHLNILYFDENAKDAFTPGPMVTFRSCRKFSSYLGKTKFYPLETVMLLA